MDRKTIKLTIDKILSLRMAQFNDNSDVVQIGNGIPLFKNNAIDGKTAAITFATKMSLQDVIDNIKNTLNNMGISPNQQLNEEQMKNVITEVRNNLINTYGSFLSNINPELLS